MREHLAIEQGVMDFHCRRATVLFRDPDIRKALCMALSEKPCHGFQLAFAAGFRLVVQGSFRTGCGLAVAVQRRHRRNFKFLADSPPGQTFLISKPRNFVTPEDAPWTANNFTGSLSGLYARQSSLTNHRALEFGNRRSDVEQERRSWIRLIRIET